MFVHTKLLHNSAEGVVLENFTLKFDNRNDFASFSVFGKKNLQGVPISKEFPQRVAPLPQQIRINEIKMIRK